MSSIPHRFQFLIEFSYAGNHFHGVQPQGKYIMTAGGALYDFLEEAAEMPPKALQFAARTDAGVHAINNLATCWFPLSLHEKQFQTYLAKTPPPNGLFAVRAHSVPYFVHARQTLYKTYRYTLEDNCSENSPYNPYAWQIVPLIQIERMKTAAGYLLGEHSFQSFRGGGCSANTTVKNIHSIRIHGPIQFPDGRRQFQIEVTANAFLRKMMRNLAGLMIEIGSGLREPLVIESILAAQNRQSAGIVAPAHGLMLTKIGHSYNK